MVNEVVADARAVDEIAAAAREPAASLTLDPSVIPGVVDLSRFRTEGGKYEWRPIAEAYPQAAALFEEVMGLGRHVPIDPRSGTVPHS